MRVGRGRSVTRLHGSVAVMRKRIMLEQKCNDGAHVTAWVH